ncbi:MAG: 23S rRNA (adenine(2503)-C(2))-methyltransferase RlmN, partial [Defluviitaleaceae bacterium]|nr:23S rRNA (adenine(2503)-C(2))-methyltransferase RlmN [Defluviitaleaceae bacterium]
MKRKDILSMRIDELASELVGEPNFRAKQIYRWLHQNLVSTFEEMTNLPKMLIEKLNKEFYICMPTILKRHVSLDGTIKYLFDFGENVIVETVLMVNNYGNSICISTQVGCKMGCTFCASHIGGWEK